MLILGTFKVFEHYFEYLRLGIESWRAGPSSTMFIRHMKLSTHASSANVLCAA